MKGFFDMNKFLKGEKNVLLFLLFLILLFILWGRYLICEMTIEMHTKNLETLKDRILCVESFGWQVDHGSELCENMRIPEKFNDVYENYNNFLKSGGFDLSEYKGKVISKYTYIITNPPLSNNEPYYAVLFVYENQMIGGNVFSPTIDGRMMHIRRRSE